MKKLVQSLFGVIAVAGIIGISSCGKEVTIIYNMPDYEYCIAAQQFAAGSGWTKTFTLTQADLQAAFTAASTTYSESRITSAIVKGLKLKVTGTALNLDGISGAQAYIKKQSTSGDGDMIASTSGTIATGATEIDLNINGLSIKSMLGTEDLIITLRVYNKDNSPATCATLTKGTIDFALRK